MMSTTHSCQARQFSIRKLGYTQPIPRSVAMTEKERTEISITLVPAAYLPP